MPTISLTPSVFTATAIITATETMRPAWRTFTYVASIHRYGQSPSSGPRLRKALTRSSISAHNRETWLFEIPLIPIALTSSSTDRVETPWMYASWIDRYQRFLGGPTRLEESRESTAATQLGNAQVDRADARLPEAIAVAVAAVAALFAFARRTRRRCAARSRTP
jgi:hypothetical protein